MYADRHEAGASLAELLAAEGVHPDVVLAVPRGGLPVGRAVADALDAPLDVVVARKMGAPENPELAIGAVASDGTAWVNDALVDRLGVEDGYVQRERREQAAAAREKRDRYRRDRPEPDLRGKSVVVVDDGVATGATLVACLRQVRAAGADRVVAAVPVASPDSVDDLRREADDVYVCRTPADFRAVGQFYRDFGQVSDEEALAYLA